MPASKYDKEISANSPFKSWAALDEDGDIPDETFARIADHPLYRQLMRRYMEGSLALAAKDPRVDGIFKDMGRYAASVWVVYLHFTGGLTLPRLKEICVRSGLLSAGRARALLIYLQLMGYVHSVQKPAPGPTLYAPSDALIAALKSQARLGLKELTVIDPNFRMVADHFDEPDVFGAFMAKFGEGAINAAVAVDTNPPFWQIFLMRNAGMQLLHYLLIAEAKAEEDTPPSKPTISVAAIARQLNVARSHVLRLLRLAEKDKLLSRTESGEITLSDGLRTSAGFTLQLQMIGYAISGAYAYEYISPLTSVF